MKRYLNIYPSNMACIYDTATKAREFAASDACAVAFEIELPDPPHEWKVGDWFHAWNVTYRVIDIAADNAAYAGRDDHGFPVAWHGNVQWLANHATPCDPPAWFTEGGAS